MLYGNDTGAWALENFGGAVLGDKRRSERLVELAHGFALKPGATIPKLFDDKYKVQAAYDFFSRREITPDSIQRPHRGKVVRQMTSSAFPVLVVQDTTGLSWSGKARIKGLGPVSKGGDFEQGFFVHSALAAAVVAEAGPGTRPLLDIYGLADQQHYVRKPSGARGESKKKRHSRCRESQRWSAAVNRIGAAPQGVQWIQIADRESDVFEFLQSCLDHNHSFVVRANQDRAILGNEHCKLFEAAQQAPALGTYELSLRGGKGKAARTARVQVSACVVQLRPPYRPAAKLEPICCRVIRVTELDPPDETDQVQWTLLTDTEVTCFADAMRIISYYAARWIIEEFHMALKTGMGAEHLQMEHVERLMPTVALMSVIALRLIDLREQLRQSPDAPAEQAPLSDLELKVLRARSKKPITTVREVAYAIARMGGHLPHNKDPGWRTLTDGILILQMLCDGIRLARELGI